MKFIPLLAILLTFESAFAGRELPVRYTALLKCASGLRKHYPLREKLSNIAEFQGNETAAYVGLSFGQLTDLVRDGQTARPVRAYPRAPGEGGEETDQKSSAAADAWVQTAFDMIEARAADVGLEPDIRHPYFQDFLWRLRGEQIRGLSPFHRVSSVDVVRASHGRVTRLLNGLRVTRVSTLGKIVRDLPAHAGFVIGVNSSSLTRLIHGDGILAIDDLTEVTSITQSDDRFLESLR